MENSDAPKAGESAVGSEESASAKDEATNKKDLAADEQMALFEEALKENDWGHQPC